MRLPHCGCHAGAGVAPGSGGAAVDGCEAGPVRLAEDGAAVVRTHAVLPWHVWPALQRSMQHVARAAAAQPVSGPLAGMLLTARLLLTTMTTQVTYNCC